ncbi:major facilitator superfamily domain-containing protein [Podospora appendiculata]|uniref:Major facilitator superfamily domain-containing protein n=1 Tax=Podospora appendiculata TaxID=314037 RepID=A0AAE0WZ98_9PEZI|nr:major facilitator superfamily domain-containing protein [Podospora appendiculata]
MDLEAKPKESWASNRDGDGTDQECIKNAASGADKDAPILRLELEDNPRQYSTGMRLWLINIAAASIMFLALLDSSIISTAIPVITSEFHSMLDIGWYGAAYQLANACMQPLAGKFFTFFNSKPTFLVFFAIFEIGSFVCGLASSSKMLIIGRAIAGLGSSGVVNGVLAIVAGSVPLAKRPAVTGIGLGFSQLGLVLGPLVGGLLTEKSSWRWCFYINLPLGALFVFPIFFITIHGHTTRPKDVPLFSFLCHKMDMLGFFLFAPASIMFLLALQYGGNQFAWDSPTVLGLFCGSAVTLVIFLLVEHYKGDEALVPLAMVRRRIVWCSYLVMMFSIATSFCTSYFLPIYFQAVMEASPVMSGLFLLPNIVAQLIGAVVAGVLVGKVGYYLPVSVFAGVLLTIGCGLISTYSPSTSHVAWIGYQVILGSGRGIGVQMPIIALQNFLDGSKIALGTSLLMFCHTIGGAVFLSLAEMIFTNGLRSLIPVYAPLVDPNAIIAAGATSSGLLTAVDPSQLSGVLVAICKSVNRVFYITAGAGFAAFCFAWGMGWKDVRKRDDDFQALGTENDE